MQPLGLVDKSPLICFNGNPSWASCGVEQFLAENWILVLRICPLLRGGWNARVGLGTASVAFLFAVWTGGILCTPLLRHNRPLMGEFTNQMRLGLYFGSIFAYVIQVWRISTGCDLNRIIAWIICSPQVEQGEPYHFSWLARTLKLLYRRWHITLVCKLCCRVHCCIVSQYVPLLLPAVKA